MKTQNSKLDLKKKSVVELNNSQMQEVNGGAYTEWLTTDPNGSSHLC